MFWPMERLTKQSGFAVGQVMRINRIVQPVHVVVARHCEKRSHKPQVNAGGSSSRRSGRTAASGRTVRRRAVGAAVAVAGCRCADAGDGAASSRRAARRCGDPGLHH